VQAQKEAAAEVQEHTPRGLEALVSGLQENRDTLSSAGAHLGQAGPQDWQAVVDADRVRVARATKLQDLGQELGKVIALR
jgi:hypothetical protein